MAEWTVMVYMNAEHKGFEELSNDNLAAMARVGSTEEVNIMVLLDRRGPKGDTTGKFLPHIYKVEKDMDIPFTVKSLNTLENENMGSKETLGAFLTFCTKNFRTSKNLLIVWDHGGGTNVKGGDFFKALLSFRNLSLHKNFEFPLAGLHRHIIPSSVDMHSPNSYLHFPRIASTDNNKEAEPPDTNSVLYVTEIAECIEKALGRKMDIIAFDACWMQNLENAYTLRNAANFVVASESTFSAAGLGYEEFLAALTKAPQSTPADVCRFITKGTEVSQDHPKRLTTSGLDLSHAAALCEEFNLLSGLFLEGDIDLYKSIRYTRFLCLPFYLNENAAYIDLQVIDFLHFLEKLSVVLVISSEIKRDAGEGAHFIVLSRRIVEQIKKIVDFCNSLFIINNRVGSAIAAQDKGNIIKCWGAQGFSIFFPEHYYQWKEYEKCEEWYFLKEEDRLPFVIDANNWIRFLAKYFRWLKGQYIEVS